MAQTLTITKKSQYGFQFAEVEGWKNFNKFDQGQKSIHETSKVGDKLEGTFQEKYPNSFETLKFANGSTPSATPKAEFKSASTYKRSEEVNSYVISYAKDVILKYMELNTAITPEQATEEICKMAKAFQKTMNGE